MENDISPPCQKVEESGDENRLSSSLFMQIGKDVFCGGFGKVAELFLFENLILHLILDFRWIYIVE